MNIKELKERLSEYPEDYNVLVNMENIEDVECAEGRTSDGPGFINIVGDGA